ncbi:hypothetical protein HY024_00470 [Candidatus Curtissbacteria bacterium]|nr:hypothetical protein [Candidatus Curtissbacteria bacterium]
MTTGNQPFSEAEYDTFLDELAPFLKLGETLNAAIEDAGLRKHRTALYAKYGLKDGFADKIDTFMAYPGKIANNILVRRLIQTEEKVKQGLPVTEEEMKNVRFIAEKHRSSQPYFVNRTETVSARPIQEVLDELDTLDDVAEQIEKEAISQNNTPTNLDQPQA